VVVIAEKLRLLVVSHRIVKHQVELARVLVLYVHLQLVKLVDALLLRLLLEYRVHLLATTLA
jgi:hypothetical protein